MPDIWPFQCGTWIPVEIFTKQRFPENDFGCTVMQLIVRIIHMSKAVNRDRKSNRFARRTSDSSFL